jgi:uncharacterized protein (DUF934 family)
MFDFDGVGALRGIGRFFLDSLFVCHRFGLDHFILDNGLARSSSGLDSLDGSVK